MEWIEYAETIWITKLHPGEFLEIPKATPMKIIMGDAPPKGQGVYRATTIPTPIEAGWKDDP